MRKWFFKPITDSIFINTRRILFIFFSRSPFEECNVKLQKKKGSDFWIEFSSIYVRNVADMELSKEMSLVSTANDFGSKFLPLGADKYEIHRNVNVSDLFIAFILEFTLSW